MNGIQNIKIFTYYQFAAFSLSIIPEVYATNGTNDTIYTQTIWYEASIISSAKGTFIIQTYGIIFRAEKQKKRNLNFEIVFNEIRSVKRVWYYVFPNRIQIETVSGERYQLFTYRRKKIIEAIKNNIE